MWGPGARGRVTQIPEERLYLSSLIIYEMKVLVILHFNLDILQDYFKKLQIKMISNITHYFAAQPNHENLIFYGNNLLLMTEFWSFFFLLWMQKRSWSFFILDIPISFLYLSIKSRPYKCNLAANKSWLSNQMLLIGQLTTLHNLHYHQRFLFSFEASLKPQRQIWDIAQVVSSWD